MIILLSIIAILSIYAWIQIASKIFSRNYHFKLIDFLLLIAYTLIFVYVDSLDLVRSSPILMALCLLALMRIMFSTSWIDILTSVFIVVIVFFLIRGFYASLFAILSDVTTHDVLVNARLRWIVFILTYLTIDGLVVKMLSANEIIKNLKTLFRNRMKVKHILRIEVIMLIYILIINNGRFLDIDVRWFNVVYLTSCFFIFVIVFVAWKDAVRSASLFETERYTKKVEDQLKLQIEHYESYSQLMDDFRKFKHDYRSILDNVNHLIAMNEFSTAQSIIDQTNETFADAKSHEHYSQSYLVDAIIKGFEQRCIDENIKYHLNIQLPNTFMLSELDMLRVITNLTNNAIEASLRIDNPEQRLITIESNVHQESLSLRIINNYEVAPRFKYGKYQSTKEQADIHGIGLQIVKDIIDSVDGVFNIQVDELKKTFQSTIILHYKHTGKDLKQAV